jgi:hypothetical protein
LATIAEAAGVNGVLGYVPKATLDLLHESKSNEKEAKQKNEIRPYNVCLLCCQSTATVATTVMAKNSSHNIATGESPLYVFGYRMEKNKETNL